ncbi:MAG: cell division protein ZapB [Treponemataceae bacterium]
MVTLEQVKLLETKVGKALGYIETLASENVTLREKLDGYRRRIDELETIVLAFKEDQGRIEAGIVSALERLNQFEDAVERGINDVRNISSTDDKEAEIASEKPAEYISAPETAEPLEADSTDEEPEIEAEAEKTGELDIF